MNKGYDVEVWARKVLPKVGENYSYAVAFVSRRTDGHPYAFNVTLNDFGLQNQFGYQVKVRILMQSSRISISFLFCIGSLQPTSKSV